MRRWPTKTPGYGRKPQQANKPSRPGFESQYAFASRFWSDSVHVQKSLFIQMVANNLIRRYGSLKYGSAHVVKWLPFFCNLVTRVRTLGKHSNSNTWYSGCHLCQLSQLKNKHLIKHDMYIIMYVFLCIHSGSQLIHKHLIKTNICTFSLCKPLASRLKNKHLIKPNIERQSRFN